MLKKTERAIKNVQSRDIGIIWHAWRFSQGTPVSSINKTDRHDMTEILLKVALNTINQPTNPKNTQDKGK